MEIKIYLSPMSGVTDLSFRLISRQLGAKHCFLEMIDSKALLYDNPRNKQLLKTAKCDLPLSAQLLGADPAIMLAAGQKLLSLLPLSSLDINSACPVKKVIKKGAGSALLKNTSLLAKIVKELSSNLKIPVTVKLRTGFRQSDVKNCVKTAKICQDNGASAIFIHGRTTDQGYSGEVDYSSIQAVKSCLQIPVFGSGNIFNPILAKKMVDETGCDGILVARGARGNPWIFKSIETYLQTGELPIPVSTSEKKQILKKHLTYIEKYKESSPACKKGIMEKVRKWYRLK